MLKTRPPRRCISAIVSYGLVVFFLVQPVQGDESADEGLTLDRTVSWINEVLADEDVSGMKLTQFTVNGEKTGRQHQFSIEVAAFGFLKVHYLEDSTERGAIIPALREPSHYDARRTNTIDDWSSCNEDQIVIVTYRETTAGKDLNEHQGPADENVLAIKRRSGRNKFLIPASDDEDLQQKLLKAFRHLLKRTKQEKNPF